jgi:hypothetical protein
VQFGDCQGIMHEAFGFTDERTVFGPSSWLKADS